MNDPAVLLLLTSMGTVAIGALSITTLNAWQGWLELRRMEIDPRGGRPRGGRNELSELRARVRRLEGIANGS